MNFSLSPPIDLKLKDEVRVLKHQYREYAESVSRQVKENDELECGERDDDLVYDFLALEEPLIKKRIQRQEQRKRLKAPYIRSQRSMCILRAREWLNFYEYPFFHLPDGTRLRRWIDGDGKERRGFVVVDDEDGEKKARLSVVGVKQKPSKKVKDSIRYGEMVPYVPEAQRELDCMEPLLIGLPKPPSGDPKEPTPVAFERNAVHVKQS